MDQEYLNLLVDLHKHTERQGPGSAKMTKKAINLAGISSSTKLNIADMGCGTGASTIVLAKELKANITGVDFLEEFLDILAKKSNELDLGSYINTLNCSIDQLPFKDEEFDVIWSEGAIYNIGFEKGVNYWKKFLKKDGKLVVSEITWLTEDRPDHLEKYWKEAYPEIASASEKMRILEKAGFSPIAYFVLPENCWLDHYYLPLNKTYDNFAKRNSSKPHTSEIIQTSKQEQKLYEANRNYYSYGVYIAQKV